MLLGQVLLYVLISSSIPSPKYMISSLLSIRGDHKGWLTKKSAVKVYWTTKCYRDTAWKPLKASGFLTSVRRRWHPTPVLLPGKSHGRRNLVGCSPWGRYVHDWETSLSLFTFMHWRRKWQPTPVFLPGESQGRGSLVGCRPWTRTESDTAEAT